MDSIFVPQVHSCPQAGGWRRGGKLSENKTRTFTCLSSFNGKLPNAHFMVFDRSEVGGCSTGKSFRFVSFVRAYARYGCLLELDLKFWGSPLSLFSSVPGESWGFSFLVLGGPGELSLFPFGTGSFPFSLPPPPKPPIPL